MTSSARKRSPAAGSRREREEGQVLRIGQGYDIHRLVAGRRLVLGGVEIPSPVGLDGHSDADALVHAIMDALLGALALGDIGLHFPNTDPRYAGADSLDLLRRVATILSDRGARTVNVDTTVIAQAPKLSPHFTVMRERISAALGIAPDSVSIKATTPENLGALGRREGIAALAIALVEIVDPA